MATGSAHKPLPKQKAPQVRGFSEIFRGRLLRVAADESHGIDLSAILQHFEVHVRTGRAAGRTDESQRIAACDGLAHAHCEALVVTVARDEAITVAHLDEVAVARLLTRESDDTSGDRQDVRALRAREIDALVKRLVTVERI